MSDYQDWLREADAVKATGNVGEYVAWACENPSPLTSKDRTPEQNMVVAVLNASGSFKGTEVRVTFRSERYLHDVVGSLLGSGYIHAEGCAYEAIFVQNGGGISAVRADKVYDIEGH